MTKCNGQRTFVARNQCNANEICADNINFSVYEMVNMYISKTRLKCKSSARVKTVLKKDWIVKKVFKSWKMLKKYKKNI